MKIEDCISPKNESLCKEICSKLDILLKPSTDNGYWGAVITGKTLIIEYGNVNNKEECFVHELLHAKCQLDGYKRIKWSISNKDTMGYLSILGTAIDNEFQHHKMYRRYITMDYSPDKFYGDGDKNTVEHILNYLKNPDKNIFMIMTQYLTLTSAGSDIIFKDLDILKEQFRKIRGGSTPKILDCMDSEIEKWKNENDYDISEPLKNMFSQVPGAEYTYFSYTEQQNLKEGFFTGLPFTVNFDKGEIIPI